MPMKDGLAKAARMTAWALPIWLLVTALMAPAAMRAWAAPRLKGVNDTFDWYRGADGYQEAYRKAAAKDRPLIIYFNVDWCSFCRRFRKEYLDQIEFYNLLADYYRVDINPEDGDDERSVAAKYGVGGYPAFMVTMPEIGDFRMIHPFRKGDDLSVEEMTQETVKALAEIQRQKCFHILVGPDSARAVNCFLMSLDYEPNNPEVYLGIGMSYVRAAQNGAEHLWTKAEDYFRKALELNPEFSQAQEELDKLNLQKPKKPSGAGK